MRDYRSLTRASGRRIEPGRDPKRWRERVSLGHSLAQPPNPQIAIVVEVAAKAQFYPPGNVPVILFKRELDESVMARMANNMFFKTDPAELDELRVLLPKLMASQKAQFGT